jgi:tyrosinase
MAPTDPILVSYRAAVSAMKALTISSPTDPRGWTRQAQIHQNFCPHGNWFFLPWHRAYLVAFERICRQLSGNANFALPYWDWTANPQFPAVFANPANATNPLFDANRSSQTVTMPPANTGTTVISNILTETNFEAFASTRPTGQTNTNPSWQRVRGIDGPLENNPHNSVHIRISGDMGTFMSPLDPIFWLHHCNIDRIWDQWNRMGRANSGDALWRNFAFNGQFVTPSGPSTAPFNVAVNGLLNIGALGYRYVSGPFPVAMSQFNLIPRQIDLNNLPPVARLENIPVARLNVPLDLPIKLNPVQNTALQRIKPSTQLEDTSRAVQAPGRIVAILRDIDPPKNTSLEVRVFVNAPPGLDPNTPIENRHYAGSFSFFGTEHADHGGGKPSYLLDLTATVLRLRELQPDIKDQINIQILPVSIPGGPKDGVEFKIGSADVAII